MRPAVIGVIGVVAAVGAIATSQGYGPVASSHLLAPSPQITCQSPDHVVIAWYPDSAPQVQGGYGGAPAGVFPGESGAVRWLGWTGIAGCGQSLTATTGANP